MIEDDADTQANLCDILELDGYRVESAMTLNDVMRRTNWPEFSIILLDRQANYRSTRWGNLGR